jgi:predicted membrane-bound mannosyltransferase
MFACKETAILHLFALAMAALVFRVWNPRVPGFSKSSGIKPLLAALATFLAVTVLLFTWFGRSWKSLGALSRITTDVLARAAGQGHQQPIWYYGRLLTGGWSGALLLALACVGLFIALKRRKASPHQLLACYCLIITAIYSLIPYKTPWLALNLWLPLAIFAGMTLELLWRWTEVRFGRRVWIPAFCLLACAGVLIEHDTRQWVFLQPADETNPYAYAHTCDDILGLPTEIADMARIDGINSPRIAVIAADPWPLPWYLRRFRQVGFWQPGQQVPDADFYVTSTEAAEQYADKLRGFRPDFFGSRPGVLFLVWLPEPK